MAAKPAGAHDARGVGVEGHSQPGISRMVDEESADRRRFNRIATDKACSISTTSGQSYRGTVIDVSLQGALLELNNADWTPDSGDTLSVSITLDTADCTIDFDGEVAHTEVGRVGLHCLTLDLFSAIRLRRLVELNLADPNLLERELAELINAQAS